MGSPKGVDIQDYVSEKQNNPTESKSDLTEE